MSIRAIRALAILVAVSIAAPVLPVFEGDAAAQVWKPKSKLKKKKPAGTAEAKSGTTKTRKPAVKKPGKRAKVAKKKTAKKKPKVIKRHVGDSDDDFTIIEEDYPDED